MGQLQGYEEFQKALKIISGEEQQPVEEAQKEEPDQINSLQVNTLD